MHATLCFPRDETSPLWTDHPDFNDFLTRLANAIWHSEPSSLLTCFRPHTDIWCLARTFGPTCIRALIGLTDPATFLTESTWIPDDPESLLIWTFSSGFHATLFIECDGNDDWYIQEILPFDPRQGQPDAHALNCYRKFLNQPPKRAETSHVIWDQTLKAILQDPPIKDSMPLHSYISETVPLSRHLSEILDFFEHLRDLDWEINPWISIRDCTYVFRATNRQTKQVAAVKWLSDDRPNFLGKFYREIKLLRDLEDLSGTPDYLLHGESAGRPYHLCRWEDGHSLELKPGYFNALPIARKINIAINILKTLIQIHRAGILHRDIAPDHVLVRDSDDVILLDFGMSSRIDDLENDAYLWFMENELSNLGFTLHTLLVGGVSFPFGDTPALKAIWPQANHLLKQTDLHDEWKQLIQSCVRMNPRIISSDETRISANFSLVNFLEPNLAHHT